jgi:hypothetical protein
MFAREALDGMKAKSPLALKVQYLPRASSASPAAVTLKDKYSE